MLSILRSMWGVFLHTFRKPITVEYPEEKPVLPPRWRGRIILSRDPDGEERCVACYLCAVACPVDCISLQATQTEDGRRFPEFFRVNFSRCIFCGLCEEACPTGAVVLGHEFELADFRYQDFVYGKEDMLVGVKGAKWQRREAAAKGKDVELGFTAPPRPELEGVDY